jgi:hypothetical protein
MKRLHEQEWDNYDVMIRRDGDGRYSEDVKTSGGRTEGTKYRQSGGKKVKSEAERHVEVSLTLELLHQKKRNCWNLRHVRCKCTPHDHPEDATTEKKRARRNLFSTWASHSVASFLA